MALTPLFLLLLTAVTAEPAHPGYAYAEGDGSSCDVAAVAVAERREEFDGGRIVDISHYYREEMPEWESADGTGGGFLRLVRSMRNGSDIANFSELRLTAHSGTHVDAPGHVFDHYYHAGFDVDTLDLAILNANVMEALHIPKGVRRVLFRTLNTDRKLMWKKEFDTSYVGFMKDGAQWLIDNTDIRLEVILVEALNLEHVTPGIYTLHCLPLRLRGSEGSPARCILIK
uniref:Cyclase family protein n=1 Tax=Oryza meridionalis TaxID=40149 RepID=A0A0E0EPD6_9ORYZ